MASDKTQKESPNKLLATALSKAKAASQEGVLRASDLERGVKERLSAAGCLMEVMKGWYLLTKPGADGTSTAWFGGFWSFLKYYLSDRFGKNGYCLSAETSIDLHSGENAISNQLTIITKKNSNQTIDLPHNTSLFLYADNKNFPAEVENKNGLNVMPLALALCRLAPSYYSNKPLNAEIALRLLTSVAEVSRILLDTQSVNAASRLAGAYDALGEPNKAKQIVGDMAAAGNVLKPVNPFQSYEPTFSGHIKLDSPYSGRIEALWAKMRPYVLKIFPDEPGLPKTAGKTLKVIQELYSQDAYHSLSIEGYQVTEELINKIADGNWDPESSEYDKNQMNALAAKGYHDAFQTVIDSVDKVFKRGKSAGEIFEEDLQTWYRQLFSPSVQANLLKASDLAGYRNAPVYIRNSRHVPLPFSAVTDSIETLFKVLKQEESAAVRSVLGHFIFVYIHPYMDGNGRIGRFLMNLMLVSGGYNWTVIRVERRKEYMESLEQASVHEDIAPFAKLILSEMKHWKTL
ncbi:MAG TPA: Fic family protein [bacterium]|nr:Fic family protein [bacterium]